MGRYSFPEASTYGAPTSDGSAAAKPLSRNAVTFTFCQRGSSLSSTTATFVSNVGGVTGGTLSATPASPGSAVLERSSYDLLPRDSARAPRRGPRPSRADAHAPRRRGSDRRAVRRPRRVTPAPPTGRGPWRLLRPC